MNHLELSLLANRTFSDRFDVSVRLEPSDVVRLELVDRRTQQERSVSLDKLAAKSFEETQVDFFRLKRSLIAP